MKGHPKFKFDQEVSFCINEYDYDDTGKIIEESCHETCYTGKIYIIDAYGTFEDPSDVSYDIMVEDYRHTGNKEDMCLFKHITESIVRPINK